MIIVKRYLIILMALLIAGCSTEDTGAPGQSAITPAVSQKTAKNKVTINPDTATAQSVITLSADTSLLANADIDWYVNENIVESLGKPRFEGHVLNKGDIIQAIVTRNKKEYYSNEIRIMNTPPRIKRVEMTPELPRVGATISVEVEADDIDGDTINYKYKWTLNNKYMSDQRYLSMEFKRDDLITVEITPYDSDGSGNHILAKTKIYNSLPVVTGSTPVVDGTTYTYNLNATDPDGDDLTYKMIKSPEGMQVDTSGMITWELRPEDAGRHEFTVLISDNHGGEVVVPITNRIGFE